ncbi:shikimate dehydrogenase [Deinococcus arenicola]|uniref:Shikimate dehydrogenase n=1 Tax=Deinococcus arenicola TaxID=2994950 RepID=A0ABU4DR60_9DEIO|nr:shikimate dehydrogenase [Deinococcus sp. ZS9-10]MDV6374928.1 shikimate dehydrogenase [Deinococcus sp. ZS9-10]
MQASDTPLALIGYPASAARALRELGLVAIATPADDLKTIMAACMTLGFSGALIHRTLEARAHDASQPDATARRVGRVDAVAFTAGAYGTFALADALADTLEASGYVMRGTAVLLGSDQHDLALALTLTRLGFSAVGVVATNTPDAERIARDFPAGVRAFPMSRNDSALTGLVERADLLVLTGGRLPEGLVQPHHTVLDLTGQLKTAPGGAELLDLSALPARRLVCQLAHATGQRFEAEKLTGAVAALT